MYRQGDVLIQQIDSIPESIKVKQNIVAIGESMDHAHVITGDADVLEFNNELYIDARHETELKHLMISNGIVSSNWTKEHHSIPLPAGKYKVTLQRQYNPYEKAIERVRD